VVKDITRLMRRHSTAAVLFHHAIAERLGWGPTDHKCLDLLRERGAMTGSELAAITGLTTGAVTGVVARLERAGYLRREADPEDGRKQILHAARDRMREIDDVFRPIQSDLFVLLETFDARQLAAIAEFLDHSTELVHRHVGLLRAEAFSSGSAAAPSRSTRAVIR
jgi:DNA-binding MarR family transcriptional regulator